MSRSAVTLEEPIKVDESINYFDGRLLTAEDLAAEQRATHDRLARLARVLGGGVASGLEVTLASTAAGVPAVRVQSGLAFNAAGEALALDAAMTVRLRRRPAATGDGPARFETCTPPRTPLRVGEPMLVLAIGTAGTIAEGRARVNSLGTEAAPCAAAKLARTVRFRLVPFTLPSPRGLFPARLRNHAASLLLGMTRNTLADEPLTADADADGLRTILAGCLTDEEVPLAIIHWPSGGDVDFVDRWAVRRRLRTTGAAGPHALLAAGGSPALAEARTLQFAEHLADLADAGDAPAVVATETFEVLPPAAVVPLPTPAATGFDPERFLKGLTVRGPAYIDGSKLGPLLAAASSHAPVRIDQEPRELLWRYSVRTDAPPEDAPAYMVLVSGHVRYAANAQYDLARLDQANYAIPAN
jgi:hypothetical protein